jgi:NAD(P)-dependent dehydrogenase (short-subunit alcohol dehydrogenase family)
VIDFGLFGKRAVVSGAGYIPERAGHGWFTSLALAEAGASVACIDIDEQRANRIAGEIFGRGGNAVPIVADMTDPAQVSRAIDEAVAAPGPGFDGFRRYGTDRLRSGGHRDRGCRSGIRLGARPDRSESAHLGRSIPAAGCGCRPRGC